MRHFLVLAVGLAVGLLIISSAQGAEPEEGTRLFCDTPAQIERAVEFRDKGLEWSAVVGRVNAAEASACAVLYFRYERLEKVKQVSSSRGPGEIVKVRILKVAVGMVFIVDPAQGLTVFTPIWADIGSADFPEYYIFVRIQGSDI